MSSRSASDRPWVEEVPPLEDGRWMPRLADMPDGYLRRERAERECPLPSHFEGMPTRVLFRAGLDTHRVNLETGWTVDF